MARGEVWLSEIRHASGRRAVCACITHVDTTAADVDALIAELARGLRELA